MRMPIAALYKGPLELNAMAKAGDIHMQPYAMQRLEAFGNLKKNS